MAIVATSVRQYRRWNSFNLGYSWTLVLRNGSWVTFFIEFYYTCALCNVLIPLHIRSCFHQWCVMVKYEVRSPKFIWAQCAQLYSLAETPQPLPPPHWSSYTRALLVSQDRRNLFVTPAFQSLFKNINEQIAFQKGDFSASFFSKVRGIGLRKE